MITPDKEPLPPDEFERLEELQKQNRAIQEAWRNLLDNLRGLPSEDIEKKRPEKPNEP